MLAKCVFDKRFISCEDLVKRFAHCHYSDHEQRCISIYFSDHVQRCIWYYYSDHVQRFRGHYSNNGWVRVIFQASLQACSS